MSQSIDATAPLDWDVERTSLPEEAVVAAQMPLNSCQKGSLLKKVAKLGESWQLSRIRL